MSLAHSPSGGKAWMRIKDYWKNVRLVLLIKSLAPRELWGPGRAFMIFISQKYSGNFPLFLKESSQCHQLEDWPSAGIWVLEFQESSHHSLNDRSCLLNLNCVNSVVYAGHLLSILESEILVPACSERVPGWPFLSSPPIKTLDAGFPMGSLEQQHCTHVIPFSVMEGKRIQLCNLRISLKVNLSHGWIFQCGRVLGTPDTVYDSFWFFACIFRNLIVPQRKSLSLGDIS